MPAADDEFGRRFVATVLAGDSAQFRKLTKPATRLLPGYDGLFKQLHDALPSEGERSVSLRGFTVERDTSKPPATKLIYVVHTSVDSIQIMLWVEQDSAANRLAETIGWNKFGI